MERVATSVSSGVLRPTTPKSKLHSACEFVGVARPKTGPWPAANAGKAIASNAGKARIAQIDLSLIFLLRGGHTRACPAVSEADQIRRMVVRTGGDSGGGCTCCSH